MCSTGSAASGGTEQHAELLQPAPGVYTYDAEGEEGLSLARHRQAWGPTMPATVTRGEDGCWSLRVEYSTLHWREFDFCADGRVLEEVGGTIYQGFDFPVWSSARRPSSPATRRCR
ncbi:MAG: hypothetical protein M5U19_14870 [Microthrixaceae bacterium]|nr:hypothetical protein [Microthrixaceae bacterium]